MLVITRHESEDIVIFDRKTGEVIATVAIVEIKGHRKPSAKLAIEADDSIGIDRQEVFLKRFSGGQKH